ncbi:MAG: Ig-like domain-containing protein [Lachnospiraceae bacterium]|nr:Ig-like domain-containing protein [Lachnospiraceae bacterium]
MMKKMAKRGLAVLLSAALVAGILPQMSCPKEAKAAEKEWPGNPYKEDPDDWYTTLDCVYFGNYWYHDTNGDGEVDQSDAKEPIKWRVLSVDESGDAFLLADRIVNFQAYNKTNKADVIWENCTLRSWLNGYGIEKNGEQDYSGTGNSFFDNAFSEEEKNAILETEVENEDNLTEEGPLDKVYLPSISEVTNPAYGFSSLKVDFGDESRLAYMTDYAHFEGLEYCWYLRSMASQGGHSTPAATHIDNRGYVQDQHLGYSVASAMGVRPVLHLDLNNENVWVPACPVQGLNRVLHRSFGPWHSHPSWADYHEHICADETCVRLEGPSRSSDWEPCSGGTAGYKKKAVCTVCGGEYGVLLTDDTPPTGKISIDTDQWSDFLENFTFDQYFKESKDVTITAEDGESGVASISYYLTDSELTEDDVKDISGWIKGSEWLEVDDWAETDTVTFTISPDTACIVYAKIVDGQGNTTYLSSDGMVFDETAPKIEGVADKGTYCATQDVTVTVTDKYLSSVTLDGQNIILSEDGKSCTLPLSGTEHPQTIKATDKAGNSTTVTVTVNEAHSYGEWYGEPNQNRSRECEICHEVHVETDEERVAAAAEIVKKVLKDLTATNDTTEKEIQGAIDTALQEGGFLDVKATVDDFDKTDATAGESGQITGNVTLDKEGTTGTVNIDKRISALHDHIPGNVWEADEEEHWHVCTFCDEKLDLASHTASKWLIDREATAAAEGSRHKECLVCEKVLETEVIPAKTNWGNLEKEAQSGEGAPEAQLPMTEEEMAEAVFDENDQRELERGKDIKLLITVKNAGNTVSPADMEKIEEGASYYTVGQYLDVNLLKMVDTDKVEEGIPITKTNKPIEVVIIIPDSLKGKEYREYAVVRLHDGEITLLEDLDNNPDTVTIKTNRFSTYAMVYREITDEERVEEAKKIVEKVLENLTVTNDTTQESIQQAIDAALKEAGLSDVTVTVGDLTKKDATSEAVGSIIGTVTITRGEASDSVAINKTIAKLPKTTVSPIQKNKVGLIGELKVTQKGKKIQIKWRKVKEADGYMVYVRYCGKKFSKKPTRTIKSASTTRIKMSKLDGKKLNLKKNFKVYVTAYKIVNGKKVVIKKSMKGHIVGKNNRKYTNVKKVKVSKSKYTLNAGKTAKIKAKTVLVDKKKKPLSKAHGKKFRYKSTDTDVAKVSKKGKIIAKGKGTCIVYVFAQNGCAKKMKVTVK